MNLVLLLPYEVDDGVAKLPASDARARHIVKHLKKAVGDTLRVGIVDGPIGTATIVEYTQFWLRLDLDEGSLRQPSPRAEIEVLLGLPYPAVLKRLWAVLASMGLARICVFNADLTDHDFTKTSALTHEVYDPLVLEGLSQGMETRRPVVDVWHDRNLAEVLSALDDPKKASEVRLFFDIGDFPRVRDCLLECVRGAHDGLAVRATLAVGPERGWTDAEAAQFRDAGFAAVSLGRSVLRTDVACIAAIALVSDACSDFVTNGSDRDTCAGHATKGEQHIKHDYANRSHAGGGAAPHS